MPSKRQREHWKAARAASVQSFKKEKVEINQSFNSRQPRAEDNTPITTDTSDTESESGTWFWNECANETDSDSEAEEDNVDLGGKKKEQALSLEIEAASPTDRKLEIRWTPRGDKHLRGGYGNGSKSSRNRHKQSDRKKRAARVGNIWY